MESVRGIVQNAENCLVGLLQMNRDQTSGRSCWLCFRLEGVGLLREFYMRTAQHQVVDCLLSSYLWIWLQGLAATSLLRTSELCMLGFVDGFSIFETCIVF